MPEKPTPPDPETIERIIDLALAEDIGLGDITSKAVIADDVEMTFEMNAREDIVVCGLDIAARVFEKLSPSAKINLIAHDGDHILIGESLMRITGPAKELLAAERVGLNFVQFFSGIATLTNKFVNAVEGTGAVLLDTRKTIPGLRDLSKYATRMGGATNHRMRLDDGVLIKDNHIAAARSIGEAIRLAGLAGLSDIEVECDTIEQVEESLNAGVTRLLLDNMSLEELRLAVSMAAGKAKLEASGGVDLNTVRAIAETGVNFISVGRITQSATAIDIGLDIKN